MGNRKRLLVAGHEEGHYQIRQGVLHMSIQEKPIEQTETTPLSYSIRHLRHTVYLYSYGLHCQTPSL